jgi:hypothetical protein
MGKAVIDPTITIVNLRAERDIAVAFKPWRERPSYL